MQQSFYGTYTHNLSTTKEPQLKLQFLWGNHHPWFTPGASQNLPSPNLATQPGAESIWGITSAAQDSQFSTFSQSNLLWHRDFLLFQDMIRNAFSLTVPRHLGLHRMPSGFAPLAWNGSSGRNTHWPWEPLVPQCHILGVINHLAGCMASMMLPGRGLHPTGAGVLFGPL